MDILQQWFTLSDPQAEAMMLRPSSTARRCWTPHSVTMTAAGDVHVVAFSDFCADPDRLSPETNSASRFA